MATTGSVGNTDLINAVNGTSGSNAAKKNDAIGKDEFLKLLITQLKNQDPLDPQDPEQFAVNLAQFTQVEQLVSINDKLGAKETGDLSSMASYLGTEVVLDSKEVEVQNGDGGSVQLNLPNDSTATTITFKDSKGSVAGVVNAGALEAGKHLISLEDLNLFDGKYTVSVSGKGTNGAGEFNGGIAVAGIVNGFIPGPDPKLLIGSREISPADIAEVSIPK